MSCCVVTSMENHVFFLASKHKNYPCIQTLLEHHFQLDKKIYNTKSPSAVREYNHELHMYSIATVYVDIFGTLLSNHNTHKGKTK